MALRCKQSGIEFKVVHNASIMTAVAACGLQLYSFGETVSIPFWDDQWRPSSFFDKIISNKSRGLHTLCLLGKKKEHSRNVQKQSFSCVYLDIKVKEKSVESLIKGRDVFEPPRYMSTAVAAQQLLCIIQDKLELGGDQAKLLSPNSTCVGLARVGSDSQTIKCCSLEDMAEADLGLPLHSLIIPGHLHPLEQDMLDLFR
jgi:diphthine synthase